MNSIWESFDKIYCINLPEDSARRIDILNEFDKFNITPQIELCAATRPPKNYNASNYRFPGEFGCTLSHLKAIISSIGYNKPVAVFEDDAVFDNNTENTLINVFKNLPEDWSIIWFGGRPQEKLIKYNDNICKIGEFIQTTGYMLNPKYIKEIGKFITDNLSNPFPRACIDAILNDFTIKFDNGYCIYPPIVHQKDGYSTLRYGVRNYKELTESDWIKFKP